MKSKSTLNNEHLTIEALDNSSIQQVTEQQIGYNLLATEANSFHHSRPSITNNSLKHSNQESHQVYDNRLDNGSLVTSEMSWALDASDMNISISSTSFTVFGTVHSSCLRDDAGRINWNSPGMWRVHNELSPEDYYALIH